MGGAQSSLYKENYLGLKRNGCWQVKGKGTASSSEVVIRILHRPLPATEVHPGSPGTPHSLNEGGMNIQEGARPGHMAGACQEKALESM